jgi:hypothetical protein
MRSGMGERSGRGWIDESRGIRTLEDIAHLAEGLIFATGENFDSCFEITNLIKGG